MTLSKDDLHERFIDGWTSGRASRQDIDVIGDTRVIIGYGWAIYAADMGDRYAVFGDGFTTDRTAVGWSTYSGQSAQHIMEIRSFLEANDEEYVIVDEQLRVGQLRAGTRTPEAAVGENEVEPCGPPSYLYQKQRA